ncbi:MAG: type II toxin-antitoxin system RelE/ParE family toxin [Desulfobacterales bacterium]|nr:type II toxin-antitoxin system RelE/ParE family toxin [Desulfobacterales bacterium]
MKPIHWLGSSRADLKAFPMDARRVAGFQLRLVQLGSDPNDWKALRIVGPGVREIRVHTGLEHRVIYVATFGEGVYVVHAFAKKTAKTALRDIRLARARFETLLAEKRGSHAP